MKRGTHPSNRYYALLSLNNTTLSRKIERIMHDPIAFERGHYDVEQIAPIKAVKLG